MSQPKTTLTKIKSFKWFVLIGLVPGILITALIWLRTANKIVTAFFWVSIGLIVLYSFLQMRRKATYPRWITLVAALSAVSLVYLFPELFAPTCGNVPRAFASPSTRCGVCLDHVCEWSNKTHDWHCFCDEWDNTGCVPEEPPTINAALSCDTLGANNWCIGALFLNLTAAEPQGNSVLISGDVGGVPFACPTGAGTASCSIPLPEGIGTVTYTATSTTGKATSGVTPYQRDSVQPELAGALTGTSGSNGWYLSSVDVSASALDPLPGSGLSTFTYSLDAGGTWENFSGTLSLTDGVYSLTLRANDAAGNLVESNQTIQVDTVTPALDLSASGTVGLDNWYTSAVQVNATASDAGSGLTTLEYDLNDAGWAVYTAPLTLSDGLHSLSLRATDSAGNSTVWSQNFQIDTITPALDLIATGTSGTGGWFVSDMQINATASDAGSGLSVFEYDLDSVGWMPYTVPLTLTDGIHSLSLRAMDVAGNTTNGTQSFKVDTVMPTLSVNISGTTGTGGWYTSIVQIEAVADDATAGLSSLEVQVDDAVWKTYTAPLVFGDGQYTYRFRATDNAGNLLTTSMKSLFVDTILPAINLTESWELGQRGYFDLEDNGSGLASMRLVIEDEDERYPKVTWDEELSSYKFAGEIDWDGRWKDRNLALPGGEYYATLKISDHAGNESRLSGQIEVPFISYVDTILDHNSGGGNPVTGTESSGKIVSSALFSASDEQAGLTSTNREETHAMLSLGGDANHTGSGSEGSALSLGGANNNLQFSKSQAGKTSFNTPVTPNTPVTHTQSDILWGATATAAIGAFAAEIARRKAEEEARLAALRAANAARNQARKIRERLYAASQKLKREKEQQRDYNNIFGQREELLEKQLRADQIWERAYAASQKPEREKENQTNHNNIFGQKEEPLEMQMRSDQIRERAEQAEIRSKQSVAYSAPNMSWKKSDYAQLEYARKLAAEYQENKSADKLLRDQEAGMEWSTQVAAGPYINPKSNNPYTPVDDSTQSISSWWNEHGEWVHGALDAVGLVPGVGEIADGVNGLIYLGEGRYLEAGISAVAMIPLIGDLGKGGKWGIKFGKEILEEAGEKVLKETVENLVTEAGKEALGIAAEKAAKELSSVVVEKAAKEIVEEAAEITLREVGEELVEKTIKVTAEEIVERSAKEFSEEIVERTGKEVLDQVSITPASKLSSIIEKHAVTKLTNEITQNTAKIVTKETVQHAIGQTAGEVIALIRKFGEPAVEVLNKLDAKPANNLFHNLDDDVIEFVLKQGPEAADALSRWSKTELLEHGPQLAMRAERDAIALRATSKLVELFKNISLRDANWTFDKICIKSGTAYNCSL